MKIKVQCDCGSKFSFEVEPVNGRMPVSIACPSCNKDATETANAEIATQLAQTPPAGEAATAPGPVRIRIAGNHSAAAGTPAAPVSTEGMCPRHVTERVVESCRVCGKPLCLKCMEQFGYVCSPYCREQAEAQRLNIPVSEHQASYKTQKSKGQIKRIALASGAFFVLLVGTWFWYTWFARNPKPVYTVSMPIPESSKIYIPKIFYRLIAVDQLLQVTTNKLTLLNLTTKTEAWSVDLPKSPEQTESFSDDDYLPEPEIAVTRSDIWMWFPDRLFCVDRQTGGIKKPIGGHLLSVYPSDTALLVVSENPTNEERTVTRVTLADGSMDSEVLESSGGTNEPTNNAAPAIVPAAAAPSSAKAKGAKIANAGIGNKLGGPGGLSANSTKTNFPALKRLFSYYDEQNLFPAGPNVVGFKKELLEAKYIEHDAMKPKGKAVVENSNLNASQSIEAAEEIFNDMQRQSTGGKMREDVSRYKVTVHRRFAKDIPDWTGEVEGSPSFFSLKTVDLVGAGHTLIVLDKKNKKLWETKLTYTVPYHSEHSKNNPCLETKDSLYFADEGMLARFDLATGNPRWRFNSVGVSQIQADGHGGLYVTTTTAGPEDIRYAQQANFKKQIDPIIIKVDSANGQTVWRRPIFANECVMAGKFIYSSYASETFEVLNLEEGAKARYSLKLINPSTGGPIWTYAQKNRKLIRLDVHDNWFMVYFEDKLVVMKFFSL